MEGGLRYYYTEKEVVGRLLNFASLRCEQVYFSVLNKVSSYNNSEWHENGLWKMNSALFNGTKEWVVNASREMKIQSTLALLLTGNRESIYRCVSIVGYDVTFSNTDTTCDQSTSSTKWARKRWEMRKKERSLELIFTV